MACKLAVAIHLLQASHIAKLFHNHKGFGGGRYLQIQLSE